MSNYKLYSYTIIRTSGADFADKTPYLSGLIEDETSVRKVVYLGAYTEGTKVNLGACVKFKQISESGLEEFTLA
jgi:uncharacterized OB-fold protein